tara:strand:+ start:2831 stop:4207 length:1377 start_codon:yes stop_codon:yes gene_type:complete
VIFPSYFNKQTSSSSLAVYRFFFGLLMMFSVVRFWTKGWIEELYLQPNFHFSYYGFEWIKPIGDYTYLLFIICFISSLFVCIGFKYRLSIIIFFLSFSYIELMDKTTYLNHYYLISCISFVLIFLPANSNFSIDNLIRSKSYELVPKWCVDIIKLLIGIVYIYAAIAKINSDWLFSAMPLKIWIASKYHFPIFGNTLLQEDWLYYFMSWTGMFYDLLIPFLLINSRTRIIGFILVIIFHMLTKVLFPIGMFPYIMIFSSIIFFSPKFHDNIIKYLVNLLNRILHLLKIKINQSIHLISIYQFTYKKTTFYILFIFIVFQLLFPFRYYLYPGELLWHEQGYRFSWRVMLTEKTALANFKIVNPEDNTFFYVDNSDFLTPFQEKQMSFQPDFILEYAHYLGDYYSKMNNQKVQVYVDCFVSLNGRKSQRFIEKNIDLYLKNESFKNKDWIIPLKDEIRGI